jgi:hypothetical protein
MHGGKKELNTAPFKLQTDVCVYHNSAFKIRAVDFRSRHFAFRGAALSLLTLTRCGVSALPLQSRRSLRALHSNQQGLILWMATMKTYYKKIRKTKK